MDLRVQGMSCQHCVARVKRALEALPGVSAVDVDLQRQTVHVEGAALDAAALIGAIEQAGYSASEK